MLEAAITIQVTRSPNFLFLAVSLTRSMVDDDQCINLVLLHVNVFTGASPIMDRSNLVQDSRHGGNQGKFAFLRVS
jgi:hypothetical protein